MLDKVAFLENKTVSRSIGNGSIRVVFMQNNFLKRAFSLLAFLFVAGIPEGKTEDSSGESNLDLRSLSFEELLDIQVTSVSKKEESISDSAAAVSVVTQEDIRRSGAMNLSEAIRLAPGMQVAAIDSGNWGISARGFTDIFANKLLVMIDGRPVYTPLFSGVFWDAQETFMEDIDRIEIVRGPGATMWGANAVNGVINVITKSAEETEGILAFATMGTEILGSAGFRYGIKLKEDLYLRFYGQYQERDSFALADGSDSSDRYELGQGGFRLDWEPDAQNEFTFQGDIYGGASSFRADAFVPTPPFMGTIVRTPNIGGGNLLGRWTHYFSDEAPLSLQVFYDRTHRNSDFISEDRRTFDIDVQQRFPLGEAFELVVGGNYRSSEDELFGPVGLTALPTPEGLTPAEERLELRSGYVQGEWDILEDELKLTLGSKFENNDYTGTEIQPSIRLRWNPREKHTLWGAVSRAVRIPSRAERALQFSQFVPALPGVISFQGADTYDAEDLLAYEIGYRMQVNEKSWWDIATFYNDYDGLQTRELGFPVFGGGLPVVPVTAANRMDGESYGVELALNWKVNDWWRLRPSYSYLNLETDIDPGSTDFTSQDVEGSSPHHTVSLWSYMDLPGGFEFDVGARYVDALSDLGIPGYFATDVRLGWHVNEHVSISVGGKNLFDDRHPEFSPTFFFVEQAEVQHSAYAKVVVRF